MSKTYNESEMQLERAAIVREAIDTAYNRIKIGRAGKLVRITVEVIEP